MGHGDVFVHLGDAVRVRAHNGKMVAPIVTGGSFHAMESLKITTLTMISVQERLDRVILFTACLEVCTYSLSSWWQLLKLTLLQRLPITS